MIPTSGLRLRAFVGPAEVAVVEDAVRRLTDGLRSAGAPAPDVGVEFVASLDQLADAAGRSIMVCSLGPEVEAAARDWASVEARLKRAYEALAGQGAEALFLCTVLRHVPPELDEDERIALRLAIRRLGLLAIQLSHATGLNVIDLDRALAATGALNLDTDYRLGGAMAARAAGRQMAAAILAAGLDEWIAPEVQERAAAALGPS